MKNLTSIKSQIDEITKLLIESGHEENAAQLSKLKISLDDEDNSNAVLTHISGLCHIKALGDLSMPNMTGWDWPNKLGELDT